MERGGWTREDLLRAAGAQGFSANQRLIVDWVQKGLLDQPTRRGLGRGSAPAVWSDHQANLFSELLRQRQNVTRIAQTLTNLPVALWLTWGEPYVPTRQVRRALRTWSGPSARSSFRAISHAIPDLLTSLGADSVPKPVRDSIASAIAPLTASPDTTVDDIREELHAALQRVGLTGSQQVEAFLQVLAARHRGIHPFVAGTDEAVFSDRDFATARGVHEQYVASLGLTPNQALVDRLQESDACLLVVTTLGTLRAARGDP